MWFLYVAFSFTVVDHWWSFIELLCNMSRKTYASWALYFLSLCLTIVWSSIEFYTLVFKLWTGQGKVTKGNNSTNTEDGVEVIVHCTSSNCAWLLYKLNVDAAHQRRRQMMWTVNQHWKSFSITVEYPKHTIYFFSKFLVCARCLIIKLHIFVKK
jgi:hypothetical protein